jgi:hypothetical protein
MMVPVVMTGHGKLHTCRPISAHSAEAASVGRPPCCRASDSSSAVASACVSCPPCALASACSLSTYRLLATFQAAISPIFLIRLHRDRQPAQLLPPSAWT